jgi:hypothetical protein
MNERQRIEQVMKKHQLGKIAAMGQANEFPSIGSDGIFWIETEQGNFTVKFINNPAKLQERLKYHLKIALLLDVPKLVGFGQNWLIFEFYEGVSLLKALLSGEKNAFLHYQKAFEALLGLWDKSSKKTFFRRNCQELQNAREIIEQELLKGRENLPVVVNESDCALSFDEISTALLESLSQMPVQCFAHGDARTDNVLIVGQEPRKILFIDFRPGFCWLDDLTLFGWQNNFRFVNFAEPPKVKTGEFLEISFDLKPSPFVQMAEKFGLEIACDFARQNGYLPEWQRNYHLILAASNICETAGVLRRKKAGIMDRVLPKNTEYFWLGQAVQNFQKARQCR